MTREAGDGGTCAVLRRSDVHSDPIEQFRRWFEEARREGFYMAEAMALATTDGSGRPSVRMVLLKGFDVGGFVFYSNYESRKGLELAANPWGSLLFWWDRLERQVRIEGHVGTITPEESDSYFSSRPRRSRLAARASAQSHPVPNRAFLERRFAEEETLAAGREPERPAYWGGYRMAPDRIEFWQGRRDRMHDRIVYERDPHGRWSIARLAP